MKTETKERPILFSGPMVRAILDGTKTQTRRIVKPQPVDISELRDMEDDGPLQTFIESGVLRTPARWGSHPVPCPYGAPGDRLWVRETFGIYDGEGFEHVGIPKEKPRGFHVVWGADCSPAVLEVFRFRPSIHMPRWASRTLLEIVSVRVERLNDITEEGATKEGIPCIKPTPSERRHGIEDGVYLVPGLSQSTGQPRWNCTAKAAFGDLWQSINGPGSWDANPYVWVVEFKRIGGDL